MDVNGAYGWSMLINGNDTTNKLLRFNPSWNGSAATDILTIAYNGTTNINRTLTTSGVIYLNGDNLQFPNTLNQYE